MTTENSWASLPAIPKDLLLAKEILYDSCGFECTLPKKEVESGDYGACTFKINEFSVQFRVAKITPKKTGRFVTLWKRSGRGPIQPLDISDPIELFVISSRKDKQFGQFIFPKTVLLEKEYSLPQIKKENEPSACIHLGIW